MYKKSLIILPLLIIFLLSGFLSSLPASDVNAQIIITIPFATATRTPTPINIGNFVWDDLDKDGRQDPGEPGISGVTVQLWNSAKSQIFDSSTTDINGNYSVIAPTPGNYRIRVVLPNILDDFSPKDNATAGDLADSDINPDGADIGFTDTFNLASNVISTTIWDAGIIIYRAPTPTRTPTPINIGNFVWDDLDKDGRQDPGEPGISGVTVQLWNSAKSQIFDSTTTDVNGNYSVIAPTPGNYRIRVVLPNILDDFSPKDNATAGDLADSDINPDGADIGFTDIFNLASNVISTTIYDAGIIKYRAPTATRTQTPISLGNFVWDDLDQDGRQDAGEPGLAGVTVQLWNSAKSQMLASTITNGSGIYTLIAQTPGDYRIRVVLPGVSDSFSPKDQAGGDNNLDSDINPDGANPGFTDIFNIASNVISTTIYDAGIIKYRTPTPTRTQTPINIGNFVWQDLNQNGIQDAGEPGVAGVTVQLWDANKTTMIHSTTTNGSGIYNLVAPLPGDYRVRVVPFAGSLFAAKDQGADDTKDSDINDNIFSVNYGFTDIFNIASNVISIGKMDAGLSTVGATSTPNPFATQTPTPTQSPTLQISGTPMPDLSQKIYLPLVTNN